MSLPQLPARAIVRTRSFVLAIGALATALLSLALPGAALAESPSQIAAASASGVVSIESTFDVQSRVGTDEQVVGTGSGFVLDRSGRLLTSDHLIEDAAKIHVSFADGTKVHARLVGKDPLLDLAVLKVDVPASTLHPLTIGYAESLHLGDPLVAIGNPFGLDRSVSVGVVSGLHRQITAPNGFTISNAVQTDTPINHGNSGGPLLDGNGRVVGVNAQLADSGVDANVGVAFAVAFDQSARRAIRTLMSGQAVHHPWLGVSLSDIDAILATSGRVHSTTGALIRGVVAGGPAATAGLRAGSSITRVDGVGYCLGGDIITAVAGTKVADAAALQSAIGHYAPGAALKLAVVRAGGRHATLTVKLGTEPTTNAQATTGCS
jgi:S1-C subfamily serine protease